MVFCNQQGSMVHSEKQTVTILILIDGFLQYDFEIGYIQGSTSHNPYFNRWFSAIDITSTEKNSLSLVTILILIDGFLQWIL